jgi:deoxycytidylate deaminase/dephospho-CoA kinase
MLYSAFYPEESRSKLMINSDATVIGLTGPFGSGSTTAAGILAERKGFHHVRLSQVVKDTWQEQNKEKVATRSDLQKLGNRMRLESKDPGILVARTISKRSSSDTRIEKLVVDGIRNLGEIEALRKLFGLRFYLFAFECQPSERWERVRGRECESIGLTETQFISDNEDDRDQENVYGQQVQLCVDEADVLIDNESDVTLSELRTKLVEYLELVTGDKPRYASPAEIYMNLAYSSSHGSKCLKRQVGAVLVAAPPNEMGEVVAVGFNENPLGTSPCVEEKKYGADPTQNRPGTCYRDIVRHESFMQLARANRVCPACGAPLGDFKDAPPWVCKACAINLEKFFWPERAMTKCTAVHAEVQAILAARGRAKDTTLYTTTFPCFQCAEAISHAGIKWIAYTEPYPDVRSAGRLEIAGIGVARFEGIRSRRFDEIFGRARPYISELIKISQQKN